MQCDANTQIMQMRKVEVICRYVSANYLLFADTVSANYLLYADTVSANYLLFADTIKTFFYYQAITECRDRWKILANFRDHSPYPEK